MKTRLRGLWDCDGGIREVLIVAMPLILSCGAHTLQTFIDRLFLTRYDADAMSAAMLAGLCNFCIVSFLMGLVTYTNTFVAQYGGAGRPQRIGPSVWQGIYISLASGFVGLLVIPFAGSIFDFIGHAEQVRIFEKQYFTVMTFSILPALLATAFSCFFSGRGKTVVVMWVNIAACVLNIILDYVMIFGHFGCPKLGVVGAAWATVIAIYGSVAIYAVMFFRPKYDAVFHTIRGYKPDWALMKRLLRFGVPNGVNFMLDMINFTAFLALIGRYDEIVQSATSIVFSVNMIAFMPVVGVGMAVSIIVGKYLGMNRPDNAVRSAWIGLTMATSFMLFISVLYAVWGDMFLKPFIDSSANDKIGTISQIARKMMYFIAIYSVADAVAIVFSSVLKGAGDTKFVMNISFAGGLALMVLPTWAAVHLKLSYYVPWFAITLFIFVLAVIFWGRFIGGKWKNMRVIEQQHRAEVEEANPIKDIAHL